MSIENYFLMDNLSATLETQIKGALDGDEDAMHQISLYLMESTIPGDSWELSEYFSENKIPYNCLRALKTALISGSQTAANILMNLQNAWFRCCPTDINDQLMNIYQKIKPFPKKD